MSQAKREKRIQGAALTRVLPTREGYDAWAAIYDGEGNPLIALEERELAHVMGSVAGLSVLDVGCGTGRHALRLADAGAREVVAIDFSEGMLAKARAKPGAERVTFVRHDLSERLPFPIGRFDRVLCGLVVDHIADLTLLFGEMARVCRADGFVVVTSMHPAMMLKGVQARFVDPTSGVEMRPASIANQLSDYVMAAQRAGLRIEHMSEHVVDEELARESPRAEKHMGWPLLVVFRLTR